MSEKVFRDTRIQIGILRSRGVVIKSSKRAKDIIRRTNYYNLINGYKDPFLQAKTPNEKYLPGTTIEEIYALYEFDRKLRILTLEYILEIEKHIKSVVSYCFSKEYGHKNYLDSVYFDTSSSKKKKDVDAMIQDLKEKIALNQNKEPSVSHYVNGKQYIPLWVLVNAISMGDISKFYANMLQKDRAEVAKRMKYGVRENELESYLFFLSTIRNRCAHDERLFSYLSYAPIPKNCYSKYFRIKGQKNDYFALMSVFKILLPKNRYCNYQDRLDTLLKELSPQLKVIPPRVIRNMMGMPVNWRRLNGLS